MGVSRQVVERVRSLPGVEAASARHGDPARGKLRLDDFRPARPAEPPRAAETAAQTNRADMYYFGAWHPAAQGAVFSAAGRAETPRVAVITSDRAERSGRRRTRSASRCASPRWAPRRRSSGSSATSSNDSLDQPSGRRSTRYARTRTSWRCRAHGGRPDELGPALRGAIWSVDKDQPVWKVRTLEFPPRPRGRLAAY